MYLRSLCQCVCSSNTGFSLTIPHLLPSFLSPLLMVTHPPHSQSHTKPLIFFPIILDFFPFLALHLSCHSPTLQLFHPYTHTLFHPSIKFITFCFLLPLTFINPPLLFLYLSYLISCSSLSLPHSPCPLRSPPPPVLPSSLSFTQCSVPRSLWLGCSSVAESLCALRCLQSIPSTRAHNQVLPLSS